MCRKIASLPAGTLLHHGTGWDFDPERLDAPAWFSRSAAVAWHFAMRSDGPTPRVLVYRTDRAIKVPLIGGPSDFAAFCDEHGIRPYSAEDMADGVRRARLTGWLIPDNYPEGDDVLLSRVDTLTFQNEVR